MSAASQSARRLLPTLIALARARCRLGAPGRAG